MLTLYKRILRAVEWIEDQLGGLFLLTASLLVFAQIVLRAFELSLSGLYEIAAFCAVWSVFLTAGVGIQRNIHVRVDILLMTCPPRLAFALNVISSLLVITMAAALVYSGYLLVEESVIFGDSTLGVISIPMWIPQLIMPIGGLLMLVHAIAHLAFNLRVGHHGYPVDAQPALETSGINV